VHSVAASRQRGSRSRHYPGDDTAIEILGPDVTEFLGRLRHGDVLRKGNLADLHTSTIADPRIARGHEHERRGDVPPLRFQRVRRALREADCGIARKPKGMRDIMDGHRLEHVEVEMASAPVIVTVT
jgi:hypothetical protein